MENSISQITNLNEARPLQFNSIKHLAELITNNDWSQSIFKNGHRKNDNFEMANIIALDIDEGCTLGQALELFKDHRHIIVTTRNHQRQKDTRLACDRFRVVLFLTRSITDSNEYQATWDSLKDKYPFIDKSCRDPARFWYKGVEIISFNETGIEIEPVKYSPPKFHNMDLTDIPINNVEKGRLSKATRSILENGAKEEGSRNNSMFKAALDFREQGYSYEDTLASLRGKSTLSEEEELNAIKSGWNRTPKYPPRKSTNKEKGAPTELWVKDWLTNHSARISYKTGLIFIKNVAIPLDQLVSRIALDVDNLSLDYSDEKIKHVMNIWIPEQRKESVREYIEKLSFKDIGNEDSLNRFLMAVTGRNDELDRVVIKHFIWQIKRKLLGLKVDHHLMPILVGKTGAGKTEAVKRFLAPIEELYQAPQDLTVISYERQSKILNDSYCLFFDEMARANKINVDKFKNVITTEKVTYRIMRSNNSATLVNNATFIGAANHSIRDLIFDPTSARRFFQINTLDEIVRSEVNSINYNEIWISINPHQDSPIIPLIEQIHGVQNVEVRNRCYVEEWLTEWCDVVPESSSMDEWTDSKSLYKQFREWMEWQRKERILPDYSKFTRRISDFKKGTEGNTCSYDVNGIKFEKKRTDKGIRYSIDPKGLPE